jgi:hypothetical protein
LEVNFGRKDSPCEIQRVFGYLKKTGSKLLLEEMVFPKKTIIQITEKLLTKIVLGGEKPSSQNNSKFF